MKNIFYISIEFEIKLFNIVDSTKIHSVKNIF